MQSTKGTFIKTIRKTAHFPELPPEVRHQFEKLKSCIILGTNGRRTKSILFSSYNHGEGTSTVVANFVGSLAKDRKYNTLLVDANTRTPILHEIATAYNAESALVFSDVVTREIKESALPKPSSTSNVCLVASGGATTYHPSEVFDHGVFLNFVDRVTKVFDFVIFDSSPIGKYYDSIVLASHVDGVVLVTQAEKTPFHELKRAKQMLQDRNIPILGVVLNRRRFHIPRFIFQRLLR